MFMTLNELRAALNLPPGSDDCDLTGVSTDTRTLLPGMLFVALRGDNFDGHGYAGAAFEKGAAAAVVDHAPAGVSGKLLVVPKTLIAYGQIAGAWRSRFNLPVIAVTGSVGKTTVKEMIALTVSSLGPVLKSEKNENNEVGVPQTLLRLNGSHRAAVIEMGMRGAGQIKYLSEIARPTIGIVTMIGESHIELLGSREAIADAKGELIESLGTNATAVLNADDDFIERLIEKAVCPVKTFGFKRNADVEVAEARQVEQGISLELRVDGQPYFTYLHSPAPHDSQNAAGAVAAAVAAGVTATDAVQALGSYHPGNMRMELLQSRSGGAVLSDCYNAAPSSVISALNALSNFKKPGRKIAFLGDMRELGEYTAQMHQDVSHTASALGIVEVYVIGEHMKSAFPLSKASFATSTEAAQFVESEFALSSIDAVLVKGSRALHLETIVEALVRL